jgi:phosphoribosylaminoimidazolecarboxamide formyltransferase/IMP cyclohydrolase
VTPGGFTGWNCLILCDNTEGKGTGGRMSNLKTMYGAVHKEDFPANLIIELGGEKLVYEKRTWNLKGEKKGLRYGENPDQPAALYALKRGVPFCGGIALRGPEDGIVSALAEGQMLQAGKHPGKTNLTDVDNGANILQYLTERPAVVILKHNNPCGAAWNDGGIAHALVRAVRCDRIAAFGGAVVANRPFSREAARLVAESFFEVVAAPAFEEGATDILKSRRSLRIMELPGLGRLEEWRRTAFLDIKTLADGGLVLQKSFVNRIGADTDFLPAEAVTEAGLTVTARRPCESELEDLRFAWAVEAGVTSNSVIFARNGATLAIGTGEQDRVGCVELAVHKAYTKHADALAFDECALSLYDLRKKAAKEEEFQEKLADIEARAKAAHAGLAEAVLVSDGFFPFRDGVDAAISEGVTAIAQPGGSLRDAEVIAACNEACPPVSMVFTGQRSFRH